MYLAVSLIDIGVYLALIDNGAYLAVSLVDNGVYLLENSSHNSMDLQVLNCSLCSPNPSQKRVIKSHNSLHRYHLKSYGEPKITKHVLLNIYLMV